jgi:sn-2 palmitoyl-lipid 9-desaturase
MKKLFKWAKCTSDNNYAFAALYAISLLVGAFVLSGSELFTAYLIGVFLNVFGISYGIHRIVIHKATKPPKIVRDAAILASVIANTSSPVLWAGSHYVHHRKSDQGEADPHSRVHGLKVLFGYYHMPALEAEKRYVMTALRHIVADPTCKFTHQYYYAILFGYYAVCLALGGFTGLLTYGLIPSAIGFYSLMMLNYFSHGGGGYHNPETDDKSANVWWLWPFYFGENWHSNHHVKPAAKTTKVRWWEIDVVYWIVMLFDTDEWTKRKFKFKVLTSKLRRKRDDYIY